MPQSSFCWTRTVSACQWLIFCCRRMVWTELRSCSILALQSVAWASPCGQSKHAMQPSPTRKYRPWDSGHPIIARKVKKWPRASISADNSEQTSDISFEFRYFVGCINRVGTESFPNAFTSGKWAHIYYSSVGYINYIHMLPFVFNTSYPREVKGQVLNPPVSM